MKNFEFKNPTKIIFGKGEIAKLASQIPQGAKVLMLYGGGSIKQNGVYEQVMKALKDFELIEFSSIPANPEYEVLLQALNIIKEKNISFMLAVGGGSVIDGTKFLSAAAKLSFNDYWQILKNPIRTQEGEGLPFGTVLTLPATGSEMNSGYVISRKETNEKLASGGPGLFPVFSIMDPEVVRSIPHRQLANGVADAYTHVLEQYMTFPANAWLQDRFAESILQTLQQVAPKLLSGEFDYDTAANFMWSCTMALNGLIQKGVPTDWAIHAMGHELTAYFGIDHARTLAIIAPSHYRYYFENKKAKLAQYAERVCQVKDGTIEQKAEVAVKQLELFFKSLGIDTRLSDYTANYAGTAERAQQAFESRGWKGLGEHQAVMPEDVKKIVEMSY